jgi:Major Facilitator Superfamily
VRARQLILAVAAGVALADGSIVTLALPDLLRDLDTTVEGVAAVIGVYVVVLAIALVPLERAAAAFGVRWIGAGGLVLLAVASAACAAAQDLTGLLVARGAQGLGGAAGLVCAFELMGGGAGRGRRLWLAAAVFATAVGPALGGALTQAFDWRAIFVFQAPVAAVAALAALAGPVAVVSDEPRPGERFAPRPAVALALVSASLAAVLFLLVLLLVAGWNETPLAAAAAVTVLPLAAVAGARIPGEPGVRASAGAALVGGGVLALAWLPEAKLAWTIPPQLLAGVGMGLSLTAIGGGLLPERTPRDAARLLAVRHAGIAVVLAAVAPIAAHQLDASVQTAKERGVALVLDAPLPPQSKLDLAPKLLDGVDSAEPRTGLRDAAERERGRFSGADLAAYDELVTRADDTLIDGVGDAFRSSFVIAGLLGLLAAGLLLPARRRLGAVAAAAGLAVATPLAYVIAQRSVGPEPVAIQDPCHPHRTSPGAGGVEGVLQDQVLKLLDRTACGFGSSREELVLALADKDEAKRFEADHGRDPRSVGGLLGALIGG